MKTARRTYYTQAEIRADLLAAGLLEEEQPIDGRAYTFGMEPLHARSLFVSREGQPASRFYIDHHLFILAR